MDRNIEGKQGICESRMGRVGMSIEGGGDDLKQLQSHFLRWTPVATSWLREGLQDHPRLSRARFLASYQPGLRCDSFGLLGGRD